LFTGIIEEVGTVSSIQRGRESMVLTVDGPKVVILTLDIVVVLLGFKTIGLIGFIYSFIVILFVGLTTVLILKVGKE